MEKSKNVLITILLITIVILSFKMCEFKNNGIQSILEKNIGIDKDQILNQEQIDLIKFAFRHGTIEELKASIFLTQLTDNTDKHVGNPISRAISEGYTAKFKNEIQYFGLDSNSSFYGQDKDTFPKSIFFNHFEVNTFLIDIATRYAGATPTQAQISTELKKLGIRIYFGINNQNKLTTVLRATRSIDTNIGYQYQYDILTTEYNGYDVAYDIGDPCPQNCPILDPSKYPQHEVVGAYKKGGDYYDKD